MAHSSRDSTANDPSVTSLRVQDRDGRGLELIFWLQTGRYAHRLVAFAGPRRVDLLESVEGEVHDCWPPSPPWQQVSVLPGHGDAERRQTILLTGAAGASHWSASVEEFKGRGSHGGAAIGGGEHSQLTTPGIQFDVACRAKRRPDRLGSTYCLADRSRGISGEIAAGNFIVEASVQGRSVLNLQTDIGRYQLRILPAESAGPDSSLREHDTCQLVVTDDQVRIIVPPAETDQGPTTFRWRYQMSLVD